MKHAKLFALMILVVYAWGQEVSPSPSLGGGVTIPPFPACLSAGCPNDTADLPLRIVMAAATVTLDEACIVLAVAPTVQAVTYSIQKFDGTVVAQVSYPTSAAAGTAQCVTSFTTGTLAARTVLKLVQVQGDTGGAADMGTVQLRGH